MPTHRELMYDPQTSNRKFKRFCNTRAGTEGKRRGYALEQAYYAGQATAHWNWKRKNPYPPGKRHDYWEEGFASGRLGD